jgi:hypothetical protein
MKGLSMITIESLNVKPQNGSNPHRELYLRLLLLSRAA